MPTPRYPGQPCGRCGIGRMFPEEIRDLGVRSVELVCLQCGHTPPITDPLPLLQSQSDATPWHKRRKRVLRNRTDLPEQET